MGKLSDKLNIAVSKNYEFAAAAASTFTDATHGLGTDKLHIVLERRVATGPDEWEPLDPGNYVTVTSTQILDSGLSTLGADVVRLKASTEAGLFTSFASSTQQGIVSTVAQSFAGDKTFDDNVGIGTASPQSSLHVEGTGILCRNTGTIDTTPFTNSLSIQHNGSSGVSALMTYSSGGNTELSFYTNSGGAAATEKMRIDEAGKVGIGTTNPITKLHVINQGGTAGNGILRLEADATNPSFQGYWNFGVTNFTGGDSGSLVIDPSESNALFAIRNSVGATLFSVDTEIGAVGIGNNAPITNLHVSGNAYFSTSIYIASISENNRIRNFSSGTGSTTMYIGNAAIQVSSDERLKTNIVDSTLNAVDKINALRIVDFEWNDPSDTCINNKNARGTWTGVLAQEAVAHIPTMVNAPRKENDLSIDTESSDTWQLDTGAAIGVLLKAIQELSARVEALENP